METLILNKKQILEALQMYLSNIKIKNIRIITPNHIIDEIYTFNIDYDSK